MKRKGKAGKRIVKRVPVKDVLARRGIGVKQHVCNPQYRFAVFDARNIFCFYACTWCEAYKKSKYRPEIFTDPNYPTTEPIEREDV